MLCDPCIVCACVCACCCSEVDPELKICSSVELGGVDAEEDEEVVDGEVEGAIGFLVEAVAAVMVVAEGGMGSQREIVRCVEKAINRQSEKKKECVSLFLKFVCGMGGSPILLDLLYALDSKQKCASPRHCSLLAFLSLQGQEK